MYIKQVQFYAKYWKFIFLSATTSSFKSSADIWHISILSTVDPRNRVQIHLLYPGRVYWNKELQVHPHPAHLMLWANPVRSCTVVIMWLCFSVWALRRDVKQPQSFLWPVAGWFQMLKFRIGPSLVSLIFLIIVSLLDIWCDFSL